MIQPKYLVFLVAIANVLWGLIPVFVVPVFQLHPDSILIMVFIRFAFSSGIIFSLVLVQAFLNEKRKKAHGGNKNLDFFQTGLKDLKAYFTTRNEAFKNSRRLVYIYIVAFFGVTLNVTTYFIGLNELSIVFMIVGAPGGSLLLVSLYDSIQGKERMTLFKGIYLCLMLLALVLSFLAVQGEILSNVSASLIGLVALVLNIISLFVMVTLLSKDSYAAAERIWRKPRTSNYRLMRAMAKMSVYMLFGAVSVFPIAIVGVLVPLGYISRISMAFFEDMVSFFQVSAHPDVIMLIVVCTFVPYLCLFLASSFWDADSSFTYESWSSILSLVDPVFSTTVSVLAGLEKVDYVFFLLTLIVLVLAILLRFVHERESKINALVFITVKHGYSKDVSKFLSGLPEIRRYAFITGDADVLIWATFSSILQYNNFLSKVGTRREIKIKFDWLGFVKKTYT